MLHSRVFQNRRDIRPMPCPSAAQPQTWTLTLLKQINRIKCHNYPLNSAWCPDVTPCVFRTVLFLRNYCSTRTTERRFDTQSILAATPPCCHHFCPSLSSRDADPCAADPLLQRLRRNLSVCNWENSHIAMQTGDETAPLGPSIMSTWTRGGYLTVLGTGGVTGWVS